MSQNKMYGSHHHDDFGDEVGPHFHHPREDEVTRARAPRRSHSGWISTSWKVDIVIMLILLLASGLGIMWLISQLPFYLETASSHYYWIKDMYVTWGTPSVRWLFINFVVLTIVAASGLLSAFGGGDQGVGAASHIGSGRTTEDATLRKGHAYEGPHPPTYNAVGTVYHPGLPHPSYDRIPFNVGRTRFSGQGYESPFYNPHHQLPVKAALPAPHPDQFRDSHRAWDCDYDSEEESYHAPAIAAQEEEADGAASESDRHLHKDAEEKLPIDEISREIAVAGDVSESTGDETSNHSHHDQQMILAPETVSEEAAPEPGSPEPEAGEESEAVESISDVYDPTPEFEEAEENERENDDRLHHLHQHHERTKTESAIQFSSSEELRSGESSPTRPHDLSKSHTFTIGRVLRRDQLVEFAEPLPRKLEGTGRKVRHGPPSSHRSSHPVELPPAQQPREVFIRHPAPPGAVPIPHAGVGFEVGGRPPPHPERMHHPNEAIHHRRRHSAESVPVPPHYRRPAADSVDPRAEPSSKSRVLAPDPNGRMPGSDLNGRPFLNPKTHAMHGLGAGPAPPPHLLRQRSIVYPPALLSQSSNAADSVSSPSSPPMQEAIRPPPPPPHFKLSTAVEGSDPPSPPNLPAEKQSAKSVDKSLPSEGIKPAKSSRHSTSRESSVTGRASDGRQAAASSIDEKGLGRGTSRTRVVDDSSDEEGKEGLSADDREDSMSTASNDVLHQQIEDFLAKFHENMRLQRQESIDRYRRRLEELDD